MLLGLPMHIRVLPHSAPALKEIKGECTELAACYTFCPFVSLDLHLSIKNKIIFDVFLEPQEEDLFKREIIVFLSTDIPTGKLL